MRGRKRAQWKTELERQIHLTELKLNKNKLLRSSLDKESESETVCPFWLISNYLFPEAERIKNHQPLKGIPCFLHITFSDAEQ